ncbi:DKNYY family protein [Acinetobacter calcoaceticus]|uniref:DKNYY family protein n=1 Tax=Acinetobacter calcoaceticus TaxID=471 RepID=A0A4R1XXS0_ACICA|nr:DKNYY family protein [Acinetobacter calcoaceticus]
MKLAKYLLALLGILVLLSLIFCIGIVMSWNKASSNDIDRDGARVDNSIYSLYQGHLYADVPSNGVYRMDQVDLNSFKPIGDDYRSRQIAVDRQQVYCGNLSLPKLNPTLTRHIGYGYISDGTYHFYCPPMSESNLDLGSLQQLYQQFLYGLNWGPKPQSYQYQFVELAQSSQPYRLILDRNIATNGEQTYIAGQLMPKADPTRLARLPQKMSDAKLKQSEVYFSDGRRVYYREHLLDLPAQDGLYAVEIDGLSQQNYLMLQSSGQVYQNDIAFDPQHAPYQLISPYGQHVLHALFASKDGIFFYNTQTKTLQRAGDNPFLVGQWQEIAPLIFSDGQDTLFLQGSESWGSNRNPGLKSRTTHVYKLTESATGQWEKLGIVSPHFGSIWKKGADVYYFDQLGRTQGLSAPLYRLDDPSLVSVLLKADIRVNEIRQLIRDKRLLPVKKEMLLSAVSRYSKTGEIRLSLPPLPLILFILAVGLLLQYWIRRVQKKAAKSTGNSTQC